MKKARRESLLGLLSVLLLANAGVSSESQSSEILRNNTLAKVTATMMQEKEITNKEDDSFLKSLEDSDKNVMNYFGAEAASILYDFVRSIRTAMAEEVFPLGTWKNIRKKQDGFDVRRQYPASPMIKSLTRQSILLINKYGPHIFSELNQQATSLEDLILKKEQSKRDSTKLREKVKNAVNKLQHQQETSGISSNNERTNSSASLGIKSYDPDAGRIEIIKKTIQISIQQRLAANPYAAIATGKNALEMSKNVNNLDLQVQALGAILNAANSLDMATSEAPSEWLEQELQKIKMDLRKQGETNSYGNMRVNYMLGQLYHFRSFPKNGKYIANSAERAREMYAIAFKVGENIKCRRCQAMAALSIGLLYDADKKSPFNKIIKDLAIWAAKMIEEVEPSEKPLIYLTLSKINELDGNIAKAIEYAQKANEVAEVTDLTNKRSALAIISRLKKNLLSEERVAIGQKITSYTFDQLWRLLLTTPSHRREEMLALQRWKAELAEGESQPELKNIIEHNLNISNLGLEVEKYMSQKAYNKNSSAKPEFITAEELQNRLSSGELVVLVGSIETNFGKKLNPYSQLLGKNAIQNPFFSIGQIDKFVAGQEGRSKSYYAIYLTKTEQDFAWLGPVKTIDSLFGKLILLNEDNLEDASELFKFTGEYLNRDFKTSGGHKRIYIIPSGIFARLPLNSILNASETSSQDMRINVMPTLRDLISIKTRNLDEAGKDQITIFANPVLGSSENPGLTRSAENRWADLPGTKEEGIQIQKIFPQALLLTENDFTIENFMTRAKVSKIIHLATHVYHKKSGILQGKDRSEAGIIFSSADKYLNSKRNPSILTEKDIASMNLADISLLVISGCESGVSDGKFTETWSGLQRALFVAGAKSALTSAWKVDDLATAEFMSRFYQNIRNGENLDTALINVQKEFKTGIPGRSEWKAPYYWAAWQLVGDWRPIKGL